MQGLPRFTPIPVSWQPVGTKGHMYVHLDHKDTICAAKKQLEILKNSLNGEICTATSARHLSTIICRKKIPWHHLLPRWVTMLLYLFDCWKMMDASNLYP